MKPADNINKLFENSTITVGTNVNKKILNKAAGTLPPKTTANRNRWSIIMHSKITRFSGIAATAIIITLFTIMNRNASKAWAIGQTIDAFKDIQTIQLKCYSEGFGSYDAYIRRTGPDWTTFQCLGEKKENEELFGLLDECMYYVYCPGTQAIHEYDLSKEKSPGSSASKLYGEAVKMAPAILPLAKSLFQTFKLLADEWEETYQVDEETGRDSVFVRCSYEPLSMSFEGVFDIQTKLVARGKAWNNTTYQGEPDFVVHEITYNIEIPDDRFDFEKRFGVPIVPYEKWKSASDLFDKGYQLSKKNPPEAVKVFEELYQQYPGHFQTAHALNNIGIIYYEQKDYAKAIPYFQKVVNEYSYPLCRVSDAYIYMGYCYKEMNQPEKAAESFEKGLEIVKNWPDKEINHKFVDELENTIKELKEYK